MSLLVDGLIKACNLCIWFLKLNFEIKFDVYICFTQVTTEKWMDITDMGHVIASRYNVIVVSLSKQQSTTFFPLRSQPLANSSLHKYKKKNTSYLQCTSTKWLSYTWLIQIIRCNEEFASGWLLRGKNVMFCCLDKDTTIMLYIDAITCPMSVISIHSSVVTWIKQIYTSNLISN